MYTSNGDYLFPTKLQILSTLETVVLTETNVMQAAMPERSVLPGFNAHKYGAKYKFKSHAVMQILLTRTLQMKNGFPYDE